MFLRPKFLLVVKTLLRFLLKPVQPQACNLFRISDFGSFLKFKFLIRTILNFSDISRGGREHGSPNTPPRQRASKFWSEVLYQLKKVTYKVIFEWWKVREIANNKLFLRKKSLCIEENGTSMKGPSGGSAFEIQKIHSWHGDTK